MSAAQADRPYDLVKELVIALVLVTVVVSGMAAVFSSPDEPPVTMRGWATAAPADVVATATGELAGTTTSAGYGPPYNDAATGQSIGPLRLQEWAGVRLPLDSAGLVLDPLRTDPPDAATSQALRAWEAAPADQRSAWATTYGAALAAAPDGSPAAVAPGAYGPVPQLASGFLVLAASGGLEGRLTQDGSFYGTDATRSLMLLADGAFLEDRARAQQLGGDQWGMMNETGGYPGQPWMWLYTFWYQVPPFSSSDDADAQVWVLMMLLSLVLLLVPVLPGLRSLPRWVPVHRLVWREHYREQARRSRSGPVVGVGRAPS